MIDTRLYEYMHEQLRMTPKNSPATNIMKLIGHRALSAS